MKKLSKILVLLILAALLFSCGGSGGGSGLSNLFNNNRSHNYSFKNRKFGNGCSGAEYVAFEFADGTVNHITGSTTRPGTFSDPNSKTGTLTITYTDSTGGSFSKAYTFNEEGHSFTLAGETFPYVLF